LFERRFDQSTNGSIKLRMAATGSIQLAEWT
jgi:hypothetical protein